MRVNYVIIFVSDMARSIGFYKDVLELPLRFQSQGWTEFATEGATIALHAARTEGSTPGQAGAGDSDDLPPGLCRPGLRVADLDAFHARMMAHSVRCVQEPKEMFGARIAQYLDPDGLSISVSERRSE